MKKIILFLLAVIASNAFAQQYPQPDIPDTANTGKYIQRTMHLLASSTSQKRNTVKILIYGQSISVQNWWLEVKKDLEKRFPNANLIMENKAIGGFASQLLYKTVEMDVSSFYPDLVLLHVYGDHIRYETLLNTIKSRTTAEVAIQTDHYTGENSWSDTMSYHLLPALAEKYKCELINIRDPWKKYLTDNKIEPSKLLSDAVHLNEYGNYLMAELIKPFLYYKYQNKDYQPDFVKTYKVGTDVFFKGNTLILPFTGNKVDIVTENNGLKETAKAEIVLDNKKPSSFPGTYFVTRPYNNNSEGWPWSLPAMIRIQNKTPWVAEEWTCKFTDVNVPYDDFIFEISGSITGKDGEGKASENFISNSGRVIINKGDADDGGDWHLKRSYNVQKSIVKNGDEVKWKTYSISTDFYTPKVSADTTKENITTLFQGVPNTNHVLKIVKASKDKLPIISIKVYKPLVTETDVDQK